MTLVNRAICWWVTRGLPDALKPMITKHLVVLNGADERKKADAIHGVYGEVKTFVDKTFEEERLRTIKTIQEEIRKVGGDVLAPDIFVPRFNINTRLLYEKAKARVRLMQVEKDILAVPQFGVWVLFTACAILLLSTAANYATVNAKLGDWVAGNAMISSVSTALMALLITALEIAAFHILLVFFPKWLSLSVAKFAGILGALLLLGGVVAVILTRTELGSSIINSGSSGLVQ